MHWSLEDNIEIISLILLFSCPQTLSVTSILCQQKLWLNNNGYRGGNIAKSIYVAYLKTTGLLSLYSPADDNVWVYFISRDSHSYAIWKSRVCRLNRVSGTTRVAPEEITWHKSTLHDWHLSQMLACFQRLEWIANKYFENCPSSCVVLMVTWFSCAKKDPVVL